MAAASFLSARPAMLLEKCKFPLAFQSALAGVLLSAETVCDVLLAGAQRETFVRQFDVLRPVGDPSPQRALTAGTGSCICEDPDFIAAYMAKYKTETEHPSFGVKSCLVGCHR